MTLCNTLHFTVRIYKCRHCAAKHPALCLHNSSRMSISSSHHAGVVRMHLSKCVVICCCGVGLSMQVVPFALGMFVLVEGLSVQGW